jgi:hypothetical protein
MAIFYEEYSARPSQRLQRTALRGGAAERERWVPIMSKSYIITLALDLCSKTLLLQNFACACHAQPRRALR